MKLIELAQKLQQQEKELEAAEELLEESAERTEDIAEERTVQEVTPDTQENKPLENVELKKEAELPMPEKDENKIDDLGKPPW